MLFLFWRIHFYIHWQQSAFQNTHTHHLLEISIEAQFTRNKSVDSRQIIVYSYWMWFYFKLTSTTTTTSHNGSALWLPMFLNYIKDIQFIPFHQHTYLFKYIARNTKAIPPNKSGFNYTINWFLEYAHPHITLSILMCSKRFVPKIDLINTFHL